MRSALRLVVALAWISQWICTVCAVVVYPKEAAFHRVHRFDLDEGIVFAGTGDSKVRSNGIRATFLVLCRNEELYELLETIVNMEERFNSDHGYDYVLLNDKQFSRTFIEHVVATVNERSSVSFGKIPVEHWLYPEFIDLQLAQQRRTQMEAMGVWYGGSESYRHMCRFYSGFFYRHPLVQGYRYYWRLEPGTKVLCDVGYDVFEHMIVNKKKYAFLISLFEYESTIPTLWSHFHRFRQLHPEIGKPGMLEFVENDDGARSYNLCHFWSNFEIADFELFRNPLYNEWFEYLDSHGGFFYERWGDAPVHTLGVAMMLEPSDVWFVDDIGYVHEPYSMCPQQAHVRLTKRCVCDPESDFTQSYLSCTPHFLRLALKQKQDKPELWNK